MLNICYGKSDQRILQRTFEDINDSNIIDMGLFLSFGDISNLNSEIFRSALIYDDIPVKAKRDELLKLINNYSKIRIWNSTGDAEDYCNFLYTLEILNSAKVNVEINVIDGYEQKVDKNGNLDEIQTISQRSEEEVKELINKEEKLEPEKIKEYLYLWNTLKSENKYMRIIKDKKLVSVEQNYFDDIIIYYMKKDYRPNYTIVQLLGLLMLKFNIGETFFVTRIDKLIENGEIKLIKKDDNRYYKSIIQLGDTMNNEYEVRILEINQEDLIEKLESFEAYKIGEYLQRIYIYDFNPKVPNKWLRLRSSGRDTKLAIKEAKEKPIDGTKELEIRVSNFDDTNEILKQLGYHHRAYQENKRISYFMDNIEIDIDSWPQIPTFVKLKGNNVEDINKLIAKLQLDNSKKTELDVHLIYEEIYNINIDDYKELKFEEII